MRRYGIRLFALGTAALASALAGCASSDGPATDGPLSGGPSVGANCQVTRVGQRYTFGDEGFANHGHSTVVLDGVSLFRAHGLRLLGSYAVPGVGVVGSAFDWPPRFSKDSRPPTWKSRQPVRGFRLAPGKQFNMVLGAVATTTPLAIARGLVIRYHDSSGSYVAEDHFAMIIAKSGRECDKAMGP